MAHRIKREPVRPIRETVTLTTRHQVPGSSLFPPRPGLVMVGPGKVRVMPEDAKRLRERESLEEVVLTQCHRFASEKTLMQSFGPGRVTVPRWQAEMLRENERNAVESEAGLTARRAGIIGIRNGQYATRPVDYDSFDTVWGAAAPSISIAGG